jgi:hypothetical protein
MGEGKKNRKKSAKNLHKKSSLTNIYDVMLNYTTDLTNKWDFKIWARPIIATDRHPWSGDMSVKV